MPVVIVYGIRESQGIGEFEDALRSTVAHSVKELNLVTGDVSCFCPQSFGAGIGPEEEIIVMVEGLTAKPERTEEVRNKLAQAIVETVHHFFPDVNCIECFIKPFNPEQGFAVLRS